MRYRRLFKLARVARVCDTGDPFPVCTTAVIDSSGDELTVFFDKRILTGGVGSEGFALTGLSGGATTLEWAGEGSREVRFTISRTVLGAETGGLLAYTPGTVAASPSGRLLKAFSGKAVTNNSLEE